MKTTKEILPDIRLCFNTEHPSFEECYAHGYECGLLNLDETKNPYAIDSKESEQWLEGWWDAFYEHEPLYDLKEYLPKENTKAAANDGAFSESKYGFFTKALEIGTIIAATAIIGYQIIDMVA